MMKKELTEEITDHVVRTFNIMFGVDVLRAASANIAFNDDDLISKVVLYENDVHIEIRFAFPRALISPLLLKIYDPIMATHEKVVEDAACEIANIVCNGQKSKLNDKGYNLEMKIPEICLSFRKDNEASEDKLNLNFVLQEFLQQLKLRILN